jgi:hypothetical protein
LGSLNYTRRNLNGHLDNCATSCATTGRREEATIRCIDEILLSGLGKESGIIRNT